MFTLRTQHFDGFKRRALNKFTEEMVVHSQSFLPELCESLGENQVRIAVRNAIEKAEQYGFTYRGPLRLFIEITLLRGSGFDTDPQYPQFKKALQAPHSQIKRAEQMRQGYADYLQTVSGPNAINVYQSLKRLIVFTQKPKKILLDNFVEDILIEMKHIFPQKFEYVGETRLTTLIYAGCDVAHKHEFTSIHGKMLIILLMFTFGHTCTNDPLYPWIKDTLQSEQITDPKHGAALLEKNTLTWLNYITTT